MVTIAVACFFFVAAELNAASASPSETSAPTESLSIGGAVVEVEIEPGEHSLSHKQVLDWVRRSACAVTEYYAGFPVRKVDVKIVPIDEGKGVLFGRTVLVDQTLVIRVGLSRFATESSLRDDWVMTHEMVHLALPSVPDEHHWIEEGIATYVEPIARAQVGDLSPETVWRELVDGLPKGLPASGDRGLDNTHTWGRTYWGGALFCLMADIEIHQRTNNRYGLQDALRGIVRAGGNMEHDWPLARALKAGDEATGVPVLMELYDRMKATPITPDLAAMWHELGVRPSGDSVTFDQSAPEAAIVRSIMAKRSDPGAACVQVGAHPGSTADSMSVLEIEDAF
ncbi:hypothetical protein [Candidatus Binatus sp.]|uniref:hypothetical protein n=1 Tax=Candidatus Binatus sp. TaxID=2811406 RepID=UPI003CC54917